MRKCTGKRTLYTFVVDLGSRHAITQPIATTAISSANERWRRNLELVTLSVNERMECTFIITNGAIIICCSSKEPTCDLPIMIDKARKTPVTRKCGSTAVRYTSFCSSSAQRHIFKSLEEFLLYIHIRWNYQRRRHHSNFHPHHYYKHHPHVLPLWLYGMHVQPDRSVAMPLLVPASMHPMFPLKRHWIFQFFRGERYSSDVDTA
jgi:hypothetical protein